MSKSERATLLVVDDDAAIRRMLRRFLEAEGFSIEEAQDGAAFRRAVGRTSVDLVLLDMPCGRERLACPVDGRPRRDPLRGLPVQSCPPGGDRAG
jgi:CheY-like chemotaxis protein